MFVLHIKEAWCQNKHQLRHKLWTGWSEWTAAILVVTLWEVSVQKQTNKFGDQMGVDWFGQKFSPETATRLVRTWRPHLWWERGFLFKLFKYNIIVFGRLLDFDDSSVCFKINQIVPSIYFSSMFLYKKNKKIKKSPCLSQRHLTQQRLQQLGPIVPFISEAVLVRVPLRALPGF